MEMPSVKIQHGRLTKKVLADPGARAALMRAIMGKRNEPIRVDGDTYYLVPAPPRTKPRIRSKSPSAK
jgi:hypothetical protein